MFNLSVALVDWSQFWWGLHSIIVLYENNHWQRFYLGLGPQGVAEWEAGRVFPQRAPWWWREDTAFPA